MSPDLELPLKVVFAPRRYFGWRRGEVRRGGYVVAIEGCGPVAEEPTLDAALDRLAELLDEWILEADWDDDIGKWVKADLGRHGEAVRRALADGALRSKLRHQAAGTDPVVDNEDDPLPGIDEGTNGISTPTMFGWLGDGEAQVEICASAPTAGWGLAWLQAVDESPTHWRVVGRVWGAYDPAEDGWDTSRRALPGWQEFWQLERTIF